jgi:hypothetical protein
VAAHDDDIFQVVQRTDPRPAIERKLEFLTWLARRIAEARADGRGVHSAVAACFPSGRRWSWERLRWKERISSRRENWPSVRTRGC